MEIRTLGVLLFIYNHASSLNIRIAQSTYTSNAPGRLEVYHDGQWGTVCDDGFGTVEATVACKQLGRYHPGIQPQAVQTFGGGIGRILLDGVRCSGIEDSLLNCSHNPWGVNDCDHSEDVGIMCEESGLRLVSPLNNGVGRLEVFYNGQWGTICDDGFGAVEATVACKQLGLYNQEFQPQPIWTYGYGTGKIWLDDVSCIGYEYTLDACSHNTWGSNNCGHDEDVGVQCDGRSIPVKLTPAYSRGMLQVYHSGSWGTVCDDLFGLVEATVVCRSLGYLYGEVIDVPDSSQMMWLDDVHCINPQKDLSDCKHAVWGVNNCFDFEVIGIECHTSKQNVTARLIEGRLELYYSEMWGGVCSTGFGHEEAAVGCRTLGFPEYKAHVVAANDSDTPQAKLNSIRCLGSELSLSNCFIGEWTYDNCTTISIKCSLVRLTTGDGETRGRLEVFFSNQWGSVREGFSNTSASVICRMLGQPHHKAHWTQVEVYGEGTGPVWLSNVSCKGDETSITDCSHSGWGNAVRNHSKDVGVVCSYPPDIHLEPSHLDVILGNEVHVTCVVEDANPPVVLFEWIHNNQRTTTSRQDTYITPAVESAEGSITCIAHNGNTSEYRSSVTASVNVMYPPVLGCPEVVHMQLNESLMVECSVRSNPVSSIVVKSLIEGTQSTYPVTQNKSALRFLVTSDAYSDVSIYVVTATNMMIDYNGMVVNGSSTAVISVHVHLNEKVTSDNYIQHTSDIDIQLVAIITGCVAAIVILILTVLVCFLQRRLKSTGRPSDPETSNRNALTLSNLGQTSDMQPGGDDHHTYEELKGNHPNDNSRPLPKVPQQKKQRSEVLYENTTNKF